MDNIFYTTSHRHCCQVTLVLLSLLCTPHTASSTESLCSSSPTFSSPSLFPFPDLTALPVRSPLLVQNFWSPVLLLIVAMASQEMSAAQKLQQEHAAEGHHVTVEDVVDEDLNLQNGSASSTDLPALSEKAAGKQKENASAPTKSATTLDTQSRELFPDLGGPKPQATKAIPKWNVLSGDNKTNGQSPVNGTPRTATPTSGLATPTAKSAAPAVHLPGRHVEQIVLEPQHMKSRDQLRRPLKDIIQDVNRTSRATIKAVSGAHSGQRFEASGVTQEAAQQALKELVKQIGSVVSGPPF